MPEATKKKRKKVSSKSNDKFLPFMVVLVAVLAFAVGILWQKVSDLEKGGARVANTGQAVGEAPAAPSAPVNGKLSESQASKLTPITSADHVFGNRDADVFIVEYSDFECPFCSRFHPTAKQAVEQYGDKVAWVYRHFPLDTIHPNARPAAVASECVAELGGNDAFWDFTDYLFENQATALSDLAGSAQTSTGLNISNCIAAGDDSAVEEQYQGGLSAGITGTPGNFIVNKNGDTWSLPGAVPFASLSTSLDEALEN